MRSSLTIAFAVPVIVMSAGMMGIWSLQNRWIYPAASEQPAKLQQGWKLERIAQPDSENVMDAYYREGKSDKPTVVYFHGNGGNYESSVWATQAYAAKGWGVLIPEYPGYGGNPGSPSEASIAKTATAAITWARDNIDDKNIVVVGNSIGSAPAITAAQKDVRALVVVSGFATLSDVVKDKHYLAPTFLLRDDYDNVKAIESVKNPVLIVHGQKDELISLWQGHALAKKTNGEFMVVPDGDHAIAYKTEIQDKIIAWVEEKTR